MATTDAPRESLAEQRRRLDELFAGFESALARVPHGVETQAAFAALAKGVRGHLRREEQVILGVLPDDIGQSTVALLQREHAPLCVLLNEIEQALRHGRRDGVLGNARELAAALALHHRRLDALVAARAAHA